MAGVKFTDTYLRNLPAKAERYEVREDLAKGNGKLALRVSPNGGKAWQYVYSFDGRNRRMTLGTYPAMSLSDAHAACGRAMQLRAKGKDPGALTVEANAAERKAPTFADLADKFLKEHAKPNKSAKSVHNDTRTLDHDVLPRLGKHKADAIERKDIRALLRVIVDRGAPVQANRTLALVRKIYNWGLSEDLVKQNPCLGVKAPGKETQRDRVLSEVELQAFLANLPTAEISKAGKLALRFQLLTAQRCGEVLAVRWDEIDTGAAVWTIPSAKAKNRMAHRVPLSRQALDVLAEAKALNPDRATVFPSPLGDKPMVETAVGRALFRNLAHFGVPAFTPHDLRRTAASHMTGEPLDIPRLVVSKILNHKDSGVTAIYDRHGYDKQKREALEAWGRKVAGLLARTRLAVVGEA